MRDKKLALRILDDLALRPESVYELTKFGNVNHVFIAKPWVVRFARSALDDGNYAKEAWCLSATEIETPEFVALGTTCDVPWIVQTFVEGCVGDKTIWNALGKLSIQIARTDLLNAPDELFPRFGRNLPQNWISHIEYNLEHLGDNDPLFHFGIYSDRKCLSERFERLTRLEYFGLCHGDLIPGNALMSPSRLTVLDWGSATTGPFPHLDLLRIVNDPITAGFAESFAKGAGVELPSLRQQLSDLRALQAVDLARWAIDKCPERAAEYMGRAKLDMAGREYATGSKLVSD